MKKNIFALILFILCFYVPKAFSQAKLPKSHENESIMTKDLKPSDISQIGTTVIFVDDITDIKQSIFDGCSCVANGSYSFQRNCGTADHPLWRTGTCQKYRPMGPNCQGWGCTTFCTNPCAK